MALNKYERTESLETPRVVSGSGLRAVAENWGEIGKTASAISDVAYKKGVEQAELAGEREGEQAIWVDPETNKPQVVGTLPEGSRPYAVAYRNAAQARYKSEMGLAAMGKVAEIGNANATNPEGFRNAWAGYIKGVTADMPEDMKAGTELLLKEIGVKKYYSLQTEDFERTRGEARVGALNLLDSYERSTVDTLRGSGLAGGTPEFMSAQIGHASALLDEQVKAGVLSPVEADGRLKDFQFRLVRGTIAGEAIKMAKDGKVASVDTFLDDFKRTGSDLVDDYQRDQIASFARGEVATEMAKAKAQNTAALDAAKSQVKDAIDVAWKGEAYPVEDSVLMATAMGTGDEGLVADLQAAIQARVITKEFSLLSPEQQQADILALSAPGQKQTGNSLALRGKLEAIHQETVTAINSRNTLELANKRGLTTTDPLDYGSPATLQKRAADVTAADAHFGTESNPLLPMEKDQLIGLFDGSDSNGKVGIYQTLKQSMGEDMALRALGQLGQERPAMAWALSISDQAPEVTRTILMGDLARTADKGLLNEDSKSFRTKFDDETGTTFQNDDMTRNAVLESAKSVFAEMRKRDPGLTSEDFPQAIQAVTGGIADVNGFKTIVPKFGMDPDAFVNLFESMTDEQFKQAAGGFALHAANGQPVTADMIQDNGILEWVGDGQYILKMKLGSSPNGVTVMASGHKGELRPAVLDMRRFAGGQ
jgi:hypothetical protein